MDGHRLTVLTGTTRRLTAGPGPLEPSVAVQEYRAACDCGWSQGAWTNGDDALAAYAGHIDTVTNRCPSTAPHSPDLVPDGWSGDWYMSTTRCVLRFGHGRPHSDGRDPPMRWMGDERICGAPGLSEGSTTGMLCQRLQGHIGFHEQAAGSRIGVWPAIRSGVEL